VLLPASIAQDQMCLALESHFKNVTCQCTVCDDSSRKIDLDVGRKVGVEVKLARNRIHAHAVDRLIGQAHDYQHMWYHENLIVAAVGSRTILEELKGIAVPSRLTQEKIIYVGIPTK
jgi:hypothetical protein